MTPNTSIHDDILSDLGAKLATNKPINIYEVVGLVDFSGDYLKVRDWLIDSRVCTKAEWRKAEEYQKAVDFLGKFPESASEYLDLWLEKHGITIDYKRKITTDQQIDYMGMSVTEALVNIDKELSESNDRNKTKELESNKRLYENIVACKSVFINTDDLNRKMRIKAKELNLRFNQLDIDDVIQEWVKSQQPARKFEVYSGIMHDTSPTISAKSKGAWKDLIDSCFDTSTIGSEVVEAILKKFMWQVKRKMLGLDITNHLMPVILGPQGVGKTTFMERLVDPLHELKASTDFGQVTDDRNIDLWDNFVLVLDEMGYASKADIESVKHVITSPTLLRRIMRTNHAISIKQNATFIGASNKELEQLIRDETGVRRFVGIRFQNKPDWKKMNKVDFSLLWQSVDERGADPIVPHVEIMRKLQESARAMKPCEEWVRNLSSAFKKVEFEHESDWFRRYKEWEKDHYDKYRMDISEWRLELKRLIMHNGGKFPMEQSISTKGYSFRFVGRVDQKSAITS